MKKNLLINIYFTTFCFVLLFLFASCSPDSMAYVGNNKWEGEMDNFYGVDAEIDDITFYPQGKADLNITFDINGHEEYIDFEGTYKIDSNYSFEAIFNCNDDMLNQDIFSIPGAGPGGFPLYADAIEYRVEMEGDLNGYTNKGEGDYKMKFKIYYENGDVIEGKCEDEWKLSR